MKSGAFVLFRILFVLSLLSLLAASSLQSFLAQALFFLKTQNACLLLGKLEQYLIAAKLFFEVPSCFSRRKGKPISSRRTTTETHARRFDDGILEVFGQFVISY